MKAVVELGGKQYLVEPGTIFLADKLPSEKGDTYSTDHVLMLLDGDDVIIGKPYVEKAKVIFSVLDQTKRRKVIVQKFRSKKGFLKTRGHRQHATQVQVELIEGAGRKDERVIEKKKRTKKAASDKPEAKTAAPEKTETKPAAKKPRKKAEPKETAE
jgi:large subunit ribosomal protein L21